jgi:hypothetical protein
VCKLLSLVRALGLHYGCIDLRQRPDGTYVFLEVNPAGQFLFIEIDTGQPLTRSMAELLLRPGIAGMQTDFSGRFAQLGPQSGG